MKNEQTFPTIESSAFEKRIDAALETAPQPIIPPDFAARVAAKAVTLPARSTMRLTQYGRRTAIVSIVVLAAALFVLEPHASPSLTNQSFLLQMVLLLQLGGLAYWLTRKGTTV